MPDSVTVYANARIYNGTPTQASLKIAIKSGTGDTAPDTVTEGSEETLTTSYADYSKTWTTNPATGNTWTYKEASRIQFGISIRKGGTSNGTKRYTRVTQVYAEVVTGGNTVIIKPNAAGDQTDIPNANTLPHWEAVDDETADGDSGYVWTPDDNYTRDLYAHTDLAVIYPSDPQTRPTGQIHRYTSKNVKHPFTLEVLFGGATLNSLRTLGISPPVKSELTDEPESVIPPVPPPPGLFQPMIGEIGPLYDESGREYFITPEGDIRYTDGRGTGAGQVAGGGGPALRL